MLAQRRQGDSPHSTATIGRDDSVAPDAARGLESPTENGLTSSCTQRYSSYELSSTSYSWVAPVSEQTASYRNLWSLTVLCLLRERPMHPYELRRLIRERKKDDFLDLKRGSLYHSVGRLQRAGLIAAVETTREGRRPERTVYRLTEHGKQELVRWLRELLASPVRGRIEFVAALSFLGHLEPADVVEQLSSRLRLLEAEIGSLDAALKALKPRLGRLLVLEAEYEREIRRAELKWARSVINDVQCGKLTWQPEAFFP